MKVTSYILLFYFCLGSFIPKSDFSQFTKIDNLFQHYELHKSTDPDLSFAAFLYLHLFEEEHEHEDTDQHENLPLKEILNSTHFIASIESCSFAQRGTLLEPGFIPSFYSIDFPNSILQPPVI